VNEDGGYEVSDTRDAALERMADNDGIIGAISVYCLNVSVQLPEDRDAEITLADDAATEVIATVTEN
jgi:hypothetical protein